MANHIGLVVLGGDKAQDGIIMRGAKALKQKADQAGSSRKILKFVDLNSQGGYAGAEFSVSELARVNEIKAAFVGRKEGDKLYLYGHGHLMSQTIVGLTADTMAMLLAEWALKSDILVSVLSCNLGGDGRFFSPAVVIGLDSFGSHLHHCLGQKHKFYVKVYARVFPISVISDATEVEAATGNKADFVAKKWSNDQLTLDPKNLVGRKMSNVSSSPSTNQLPMPNPIVKYTKIGFEWKGDTQVRHWVGADQKGLPGVPMSSGTEWDLLDHVSEGFRKKHLAPLIKEFRQERLTPQGAYMGGAYETPPKVRFK